MSVRSTTRSNGGMIIGIMETICDIRNERMYRYRRCGVADDREINFRC